MICGYGGREAVVTGCLPNRVRGFSWGGTMVELLSRDPSVPRTFYGRGVRTKIRVLRYAQYLLPKLSSGRVLSGVAPSFHGSKSY